jgi:hypothetical protein
VHAGEQKAMASRVLASVGLTDSEKADEGRPRPESSSVLDRVREMFCGLQGHNHLLQFRRDRLYLKCASCGQESPGWELKGSRRPDAPADERSKTIRALLDERRIA